VKCHKCHSETPGEMHFCGHCGASLAGPGKTFDISKTQTLAFSPGLLSEGTMFAGRYLVIDDLGKGGMGHVYRVLDTKIDEEVALKFINAEIAADAKIIERFRNELKFTRKITHRNVCRMFDLSEDGKSLFITMEYIPGEDLGDILRKRGRLPLEKAFPIAQQVCEGLAEVHRLGVVHRDLKPKNIMIDREGNAKIMDFGLARTPHGVKLTEVGQVVGTPAFMSPEQVNGENVDQRSDLFALGIIMFAMLTDKLPFEADTTLALALLHKTHRPPNPNSLNPRISKELGQVILKCLEVEKEKRYQTAQELLADLKRIGKRFDTYAISVPAGAKAKRTRPIASFPWGKVITVASLMLALTASGLAVRTLIKRSRLNAERKLAIQEIDRLIRANDLSSAFQLARQFEKEAPADPRLVALWPRMSSTLSIRTIPPGATVSLKDERSIGMDMQVVGQTPLDNVRVPLSQVRFRIEKEGYVTLEDMTSDVGGSINCLLGEKNTRLTDPKLALVDEIIQNGNRTSYKINAGLDHGVLAGDKGAIYDQKGGGPGEGVQVVARFLVKELQRDRSLIETRNQKGNIRLGDLIKFEERMTAVPVTISTVPDRASLFIDGVQMGLSGSPVNLSPGRHTLRLVKPGYRDFEKTIEVGADGRIPLIKMIPKAPTKDNLDIVSEPSEAEAVHSAQAGRRAGFRASPLPNLCCSSLPPLRVF
jgi:tRNA A-37 threonylcarbamoyl transferase component Bud32